MTTADQLCCPMPAPNTTDDTDPDQLSSLILLGPWGTDKAEELAMLLGRLAGYEEAADGDWETPARWQTMLLAQVDRARRAEQRPPSRTEPR